MLGQVGIGMDKPERKRPAKVMVKDGMNVVKAVAGGMYVVPCASTQPSSFPFLSFSFPFISFSFQ